MSYYRTHQRIRQYLADYAADRALVHCDLHRARVDQLYSSDPIVATYTVGWDRATRTPYAQRDELVLFPPGTPDHIAADIKHRLMRSVLDRCSVA